MRISGVLTCSLVNGEGVRYVIFTQGCAHYCKGCQNPDTWDFNGGYEIDLDSLVADISKRRKYLDGITLSGGDPFYQQEECVKLLKMLPDMNVWIYTGFDYADICDTELARLADVIVDGPFVEELKCEGQYFGSSNQKINKSKELIPNGGLE
jgi:anaerobic ribonucleoside-triphosphate reductase activating protein